MKTLGDRPVAKAARRLRGQLYIDRGPDQRKTVFLAGSGRSGTTWLADIVNYRNDYRYIHEPFHRHQVRICRAFGYRQYLRPDVRDSLFVDPARRILTGRLRSLWADQYNRTALPRRRFVKEVRANLFLKWLHVSFPEVPIVLLLRHPCAVASSRLKVDWSGGADLRQFLKQPDLMHDHLEQYRDVLEETDDLFERMIVFWCVENLVPLRQLGRGEVHVLFYESLCVDTESEIRRLFAFLGMPFEPAVLEGAGRPSQATRRDSAVVSGGSLVEGWRTHISTDQVTRATDILERFGLDRLYAGESMPVLPAADEALAG
jgi:hypothetical protein